ncbi:Grx4 family monothiol glutaredoxin [Nannocystis pusilla]|uniref:Grx4 family monothiol glutaredoxin n=1 Tax=Nannocystis pusilla TaxID=889268 RepID=UPI003B77CF31
MPLTEALRDKIQGLITADSVVLFMKGTRFRPACGFSAGVVEVLDSLVPGWTSVDVLADAELREGIKEFSAWPTIPQLYVRGEFVGGADIVREMHASGELATLLGAVGVKPPQVQVSARAAGCSARSRRRRAPARPSACASARASSTTWRSRAASPATSRSSSRASRCCSIA